MALFEGGVLGASQSGKRSRLRLPSLLRDSKLITDARAEDLKLVAVVAVQDQPSRTERPSARQ